MNTNLARALIGLSLLFSLVQSELCPLCETAADMPKRWGFKLQDGRTCRDVYLALAALDVQHSECEAGKREAQALCCQYDEPEPFYFPPSASPVYSGQVGAEPDCPICGTMEYPGKPNEFIIARYVGEFTCAQLYDRGLNGMIPSFMCGPLQDFTESACGCGQFNPNNNNNPPAPQATPNPPAPQATPATVASPAAAPSGTEMSERKVPPETGKYTTRLSDGRGGAGSYLRGDDRRTTEQVNPLQEIDEPTTTMASPLMEADE
jgi:hypothetical protein